MPLTPSDVEQMTFSTALRGYDLDEVDDFLDQVVVAIRDLMDDLAAARGRAADLDREGGSVSSGADEAAVGRALVAAQQAGDKIIEDAKAEAEAILETAKTEAESFEAERAQLKEQARAEMTEHSQRVAEVRNQLALLATQVSDKLDAMDVAIGDELMPDGGAALDGGEETIDLSSAGDADASANEDAIPDESVDQAGPSDESEDEASVEESAESEDLDAEPETEESEEDEPASMF